MLGSYVHSTPKLTMQSEPVLCRVDPCVFSLAISVALRELARLSESWFSEGGMVIPAKKKGCGGEAESDPQIVFFPGILLPSFSVMGTPQPWSDCSCLGPMLSKEPPPLVPIFSD